MFIITETQKARWLETWKTSPCFTRFQHIDTSFPFNKFQKISSVLSRSQSSLLIQLWTGHIPLNSYLHPIKKSATRHCTNCWDTAHGSIIEMVIHYLFECQTYTTEHNNMDRALGCHSRDLKGILGRLDRIKELLKYVGRTARFKTTLGDAILYHFDWFVQHVTFSCFQKMSENRKNWEKYISKVRKKWVWCMMAESIEMVQ